MPRTMDYGNEVDLSNNNITPLWRRRPANPGSRDLKIKPRPLSYQIDGVLMTDFPVEDKCAFTLTQPAEKIVATPAGGTVILKHVLNQPTRKTRVVRSISIGHLSSGRFSLQRGKQVDEDRPVDNRNVTSGTTRMINGTSVCQDGSKNVPSLYTVTSQRDQIGFGNSASSSDHIRTSCSTPPYTLSVASPYHRQEPGSSSPSLRASPRSSSSSIMSLSSTPSTLSDPPTPRTPSPDDGVSGGLIPRQPPKSDGKHSPVILSTQSPAALKLGTQQLIPQGLVSETRPLKTGRPGGPNKGPAGLLDPGERALRARSMVETSSFSRSSEQEEDAEGGDSPGGLLRRGLRSTSYRRAVVSGVDPDVSPTDLKPIRLSQPMLKGVAEDREHPPSPGKSKVCMLFIGLTH